MPRTTTLTEADKSVCRQLKQLRQALKIPRTVFASTLGMSNPMLTSRESGVTPWTVGEIDQAKTAVAAHLNAAGRALADLPF